MNRETSASVRNLVYLSFHPKDRLMLDRFEIHLETQLKRSSLSFWSVKQIPAGAEGEQEIEQALSQACVLVLLVSADYLATSELERMITVTKEQAMPLLWLPVSASAYQATELAGLAPLLDAATPLASLPKSVREAELVRICKLVMATIAVAPAESVPVAAQQAKGVPDTTLQGKRFAAIAQTAPLVLLIIAVCGGFTAIGLAVYSRLSKLAPGHSGEERHAELAPALPTRGKVIVPDYVPPKNPTPPPRLSPVSGDAERSTAKRLLEITVVSISGYTIKFAGQSKVAKAWQDKFNVPDAARATFTATLAAGTYAITCSTAAGVNPSRTVLLIKPEQTNYLAHCPN